MKGFTEVIGQLRETGWTVVREHSATNIHIAEVVCPAPRRVVRISADQQLLRLTIEAATLAASDPMPFLGWLAQLLPDHVRPRIASSGDSHTVMLSTVRAPSASEVRAAVETLDTLARAIPQTLEDPSQFVAQLTRRTNHERGLTVSEPGNFTMDASDAKG